MQVLYYRDMCIIDNRNTVGIQHFLSACSMFLNMFLTPGLYIRIFVVVKRASKMVGATGRGAKVTSDKKAVRTALVLFILYLAFFVTFVPYTINIYVRVPHLETKR